MAAVRAMFPLAAAIANISRRPKYFKTTTFKKKRNCPNHIHAKT
jgi:hypothetical protein